MGRKLNFTSLFSRGLDPTTKASSPCNSTARSSSWAHWPSCKHPSTNSFHYRAEHSLLFNSNDSSFTHSSESMTSNDGSDCIDDSEAVIRGLMRSNRLFYEPGGNSSSILEEATKSGSILKRTNRGFSEPGCNSNSKLVEANRSSSIRKSSAIPFEDGTIVMAMESEDPYNDFRKSMEEMVVAHGLIKDWDCLEELLVWYLRVNGKKNHGFIVGAFVDLLVGLGSSGESFEKISIEKDVVLDSCCGSNSSPTSFEIEEVEEEEGSGSC